MCVRPQIPNEAPFCDPAGSFSHLKLNLSCKQALRSLFLTISDGVLWGEFSLRTTTGIPRGQGSVLGTLWGSTARCRVGSSPFGVRLLERYCTAHVQLSQPTGWRQQLLTSEGIVAQALQQPTTRLQLSASRWRGLPRVGRSPQSPSPKYATLCSRQSANCWAWKGRGGGAS